MPLLYWTVTIVFSISVTAVVSGSQVGTSGLTARTIVPSSTPDCWSPSCLTWSQCLADPSLCFTSYTTVTIQPGEYVLHEYVGVTGVESLSIYGSRSEVNGSARENRVIINCEYREGGIRFTNVTDFSLSGITMLYCGVQGASRGLRKEVLHYFALHVAEGVNVSLSFLFISNSTQIGLLCMNLLGTSGIWDSVITHSNYRLLEKYMKGEMKCLKNKWECHGNNVWVVFLNTSNMSNFIIERTNVTFGVNLKPTCSQAMSHGAGVSVYLDPGLDYGECDILITISKCCFMNNIGTLAAHLYVVTFSGCSVLVKDSNFMHANKRTEGNPMELKLVKPVTLALYINDMDGIGIDAEIVMNRVHIAENVGGGLQVSLISPLAQSYIQLRMKNVKVVQNSLVLGNYKLCIGYIVQFAKEIVTNGGGLNVSLDSVDIGNNNVVFQTENTWSSNPICIGSLLLINTEVHFKQTRFFNNNIPAVSTYNSNVHFHGVNVFENNTGRLCGGALVLRVDSLMYLHQGTQVYVLNNTALRYGGGICVDGGKVPNLDDKCFWQVLNSDILSKNDTFVYFEGNIAPITGHAIYAGSVINCNSEISFTKQGNIIPALFVHIFQAEYPDIPPLLSWYQTSSQSFTVCFCYPGPQIMCDGNVVPSISVYPGQTFQVLAAGMGVGISPAVVRSRINGKYKISPELQSLGNACEPLNYTLLAPENISGIFLQLTVRDSADEQPTVSSMDDKYINLTTISCPQGFLLQELKCGCYPMLQQASVECNINTQTFTRSGSVWIGMGSDEEGLLTHMHCPNAYCKLQETDFNLTSPDVQCASGHAGVLCGECESGLALMLGSSNCQYCSNIYLLLILPFLAAGVLLFIILGRLDITVASGTMNGVLFYANVVKASNDALISNSVSKYFMILSSWLNLDLGIETCFSSHLDMFWKVLLQFAFPLYIWLLVAAIILLSRYSTVAARLSGSNSVPVLATLFLLSYAKVLATIIVAFSFTSLEAEKFSPLVWLHDGNLRFLQGKHIALVLVSTLFALFYIIPLTLLLVFAPLLRRAHNHRIVRLVQRLKPLLDAFQGPYKDRFHWWPGLMLVIRIILFIALTTNTKHDPRLSTLFVGVTALPLIVLSAAGVYKNKLLNFHETALNVNMAVFVLWSLFNYSSYQSRTQFIEQQQATSYTMITIFYVLFMAVLVYHISKKLTDLGIPRYLFNLLRRRGGLANDNGEIAVRERQGSGCAPVPARPPTVTFVELREPLLTD